MYRMSCDSGCVCIINHVIEGCVHNQYRMSCDRGCMYQTWGRSPIGSVDGRVRSCYSCAGLGDRTISISGEIVGHDWRHDCRGTIGLGDTSNGVGCRVSQEDLRRVFLKLLDHLFNATTKFGVNIELCVKVI